MVNRITVNNAILLWSCLFVRLIVICIYYVLVLKQQLDLLDTVDRNFTTKQCTAWQALTTYLDSATINYMRFAFVAYDTREVSFRWADSLIDGLFVECIVCAACDAWTISTTADPVSRSRSTSDCFPRTTRHFSSATSCMMTLVSCSFEAFSETRALILKIP